MMRRIALAQESKAATFLSSCCLGSVMKKAGESTRGGKTTKNKDAGHASPTVAPAQPQQKCTSSQSPKQRDSLKSRTNTSKYNARQASVWITAFCQEQRASQFICAHRTLVKVLLHAVAEQSGCCPCFKHLSDAPMQSADPEDRLIIVTGGRERLDCQLGG